METDLECKTTSEFRTAFHSPQVVTYSQISLYMSCMSDVCAPSIELLQDMLFCITIKEGQRYKGRKVKGY